MDRQPTLASAAGRRRRRPATALLLALAASALLLPSALAGDSPSPVESLMKLAKAYAKWEANGVDAMDIDIEGTSDWYRRYFINYPALKVDSFLTPPAVNAASQSAKKARLSTLMCPALPFDFDCEVNSAIIHGSATGHTDSHTWNVGATTKHTLLYGAKFLGTGAKAGPVGQFSFSWSSTTTDTDVTTEQSTSTGGQRVSNTNSTQSCFEIAAYASRHTQTGTSELQATFTNWIGFHHDDSEVWKDDNESHYYRLRHVWWVVQRSLEAGLPQAAEFAARYSDALGWHATMSNVISFDFFLASDGATTFRAHNASSDECAKMRPSGWDWVDPSPSGRRLLAEAAADDDSSSPVATAAAGEPQLLVSLVPGSGRQQPAGGDSSEGVSEGQLPASIPAVEPIPRSPASDGFGGNSSAPRRLLRQLGPRAGSGAPTSLDALPAGPSGPAAAVAPKDCPGLVALHNTTNQLLTTTTPLCTQLAAEPTRVAAARVLPLDQRPCTAKVPSDAAGSMAPSNASSEVASPARAVVYGAACNIPATPKEQLDQREAQWRARFAQARAAMSPGSNGTSTRLALGATAGDYWSKLQKLVETICFDQSGGDSCEVDYNGNTDWWGTYFSGLPIARVVAGADEIRMNQGTSFSATTSSWYCQHNPYTKSLCTLQAQDMESTAHTHVETSAWNFQFKLGFKVKATASFFGIGPQAEYETENTVDWGYSFSDGDSTTTTDGASTAATVRVTLAPEDGKCAHLSLTTRKAKAAGSTRAWVCASGWVGTHQHPNKHWRDYDGDGESHYFRAMTVGEAVRIAQVNNLAAGDAWDWFIDARGRACLANAVDFSFEQGVMSFVSPQLFDKDSPECNPAALGVGPAQLAPAASRGATPEVPEFAAIPIPGAQRVVTPCASFEACGNPPAQAAAARAAP